MLIIRFKFADIQTLYIARLLLITFPTLDYTIQCVF